MTPNQKISLFFKEKVKNVQLGHDDEIFTSGLVNSLLAIQLVQYLENEFSIAITSDDLDLDNFNTIVKINNFIAKKINHRANSDHDPITTQ